MRQEKENPVAIITGGARRIGKSIAKTLHQKGFDVIIHCHQSLDESEALAKALNAARANSAMTHACDLTNIEAIKKLIENAKAFKGRLDVLVNNASIFKATDLNNAHEKDWDTLFATNAKAPFFLSMYAYHHLFETKGAIINITDIHADNPLKGYSAYCQSKAALLMQTKSLAIEFAPNVRVNAIAPGAIAWPEGENELTKDLKEKIIQKTPLKRHGEPAFIAQAVLALIENPFVTGQILPVDGGRSLL